MSRVNCKSADSCLTCQLQAQWERQPSCLCTSASRPLSVCLSVSKQVPEREDYKFNPKLHTHTHSLTSWLHRNLQVKKKEREKKKEAATCLCDGCYFLLPFFFPPHKRNHFMSNTWLVQLWLLASSILSSPLLSPSLLHKVRWWRRKLREEEEEEQVEEQSETTCNSKWSLSHLSVCSVRKTKWKSRPSQSISLLGPSGTITFTSLRLSTLSLALFV